VYKNFAATIVWFNESEALAFIEKFYCSLHYVFNFML
jgi:hypothetical protein